MDTIKTELLKALTRTGETPDDLEAILYQPVPEGVEDTYYEYNNCDSIRQVTFDELPDREYRSMSHDGPHGEPLIAFSKNYVYFTLLYDGEEKIEPVPRRPEAVGSVIKQHG